MNIVSLKTALALANCWVCRGHCGLCRGWRGGASFLLVEGQRSAATHWPRIAQSAGHGAGCVLSACDSAW